MQHLNKPNLPPTSLWLLLACALTFSACEMNDVILPPKPPDKETVVEEFSFEIEARKQSRLRLEGINGEIDVTGVPGASKVEIWGERRVKAESIEDANAWMKKLEVRVSESNDEIFVKTIQPKETQGRTLEVVYHVRMPQAWEALVSNLNGSVFIDSLAGKATIVLLNGNVELREISKTISIGLTNGGVTLAHITGNTFVTLVNGNIDASLTLPQQGTCELGRVNGTVDLQIPQNTSAKFSAEVVNGAISTNGLAIHDAITTPKSVSGRLANGDGKIAIKTVNGNIRVEGI